MNYEDIIQLIAQESGMELDSSSPVIKFALQSYEGVFLLEKGEDELVFASVDICPVDLSGNSSLPANILLNLNADTRELGQARISCDIESGNYYLFQEIGTLDKDAIVKRCETLINTANQIRVYIYETLKIEHKNDQEKMSEDFTILDA